MPMGPGKYDDLCTYVRERAEAEGAVVIVLNGRLGSGFSCQADALQLVRLPAMLDELARQIRAIQSRGEC